MRAIQLRNLQRLPLYKGPPHQTLFQQFSRVLKQRAAVYRRAIFFKKIQLETCPGNSTKISEYSKFQNLVKSPFLVPVKPAGCNPQTPVKKEFLNIFRRATFWNIPIHNIEIQKSCRMQKCFSLTLLKSDSIVRFLLVILKMSVQLQVGVWIA